MNDNDIKKCIKNGYCWSSCGDKPDTTPTRDYTRGQLKTFEGLHATKAAAKLAIATRREDERVAQRKADAEHDHFLRTWKGRLTGEIVHRNIRRAEHLYEALVGKTYSVWTWCYGGSEKSYFDEHYVFLSESEAKTAAHDLWLSDRRKNQMEPITLEQGKMLRDGDKIWRTFDSYGISDLTLDTDSIRVAQAFGGIVYDQCAYFTYLAAKSALDKSKAVESHETPVGETQPKEVATGETQDKEPVKYMMDGDEFCGITPEWKAWKERHDAKAKPELPGKPTTVRGWLETIPDPAIRAAANRIAGVNCRHTGGRVQTSLSQVIIDNINWDKSPEGPVFWKECYWSALFGDPWPSYPPKAKQLKDGWTDKEIEKAAFKPKEWTDIPQVVTKRNKTDDSVTHPKHYTSHPSGIECIQVTEHMNFCRGNAVKYVWRAGEKGNEIEDLKKARWYLDREIARLEKAKESK